LKLNNTFSLESDKACPYTFLSDIWMYIEQLKFIGKVICLCIFAVGSFLCFMGNRLITITIFIVSSIFSVLIIYNLIFNFIGVEGSTILNAFIVLIALGSGLGLGYLIKKNKKIWLSFLLGTISAILFDLLIFLVILGHLNVPSVIKFYFFKFNFLINHYNFFGMII
jgi:hypothetical protein